MFKYICSFYVIAYYLAGLGSVAVLACMRTCPGSADPSEFLVNARHQKKGLTSAKCSKTTPPRREAPESQPSMKRGLGPPASTGRGRSSRLPAAIRLGDAAPLLVPSQPWRDIRGMGNRLRHAYDRISVDVIWNAIGSDLPSWRRMPESLSTSRGSLSIPAESGSGAVDPGGSRAEPSPAHKARS
jgi:Protein of unknown function DUF86